MSDAWTQECDETLLGSDTKKFNTSRKLSETLLTNDVKTKNTGKKLADTINTNDTKTKKIFRKLTETANLSTGELGLKAIALSETIKLLDTIPIKLQNGNLSTNNRVKAYYGTYQQVVNALDAEGVPEHKVKGFAFSSSGSCIVLVYKH